LSEATQEEDFVDEKIRPIADCMTHNTCAVLHEHLCIQTRQEPNNGSLDGGAFSTKIRDAIEEAFSHAMRLNAEAEAAGELLNVEWFPSGTDFDPATMQIAFYGAIPPRDGSSSVLMTVLPHVRRWTVKGELKTASRAFVIVS
jgi:hypothetical protein